MSQTFPPTYVNEVNTLNREILKAQPNDILQFCANFFNKRLESQRAEFLLSTSNNSAGSSASAFGGFNSASGGKQAAGFGGETTFPGFGSTGSFGGTSSPPPMSDIGPDTRIDEEDLDDVHQSPTSQTFAHNVFGPTSSMAEQVARISSSPPSAPSAGSNATLSPRGRFQDLPGSSSGNLAPSSAFRSPSPNKDFPTNYNMNRRTSVSAESMVPSSSSDEWSPPVIPKTSEQLQRLRNAIASNFLFMHLEEEQMSQVLNALAEKPVPHKDTRVITQGDVGDYFYIVEKGGFDIYVNPAGKMMPGVKGMGDKVTSIGPGGSFGELALMYNSPRAATIITNGPGNILWALDRVTFRRILMENTFKRRRMYEAFLETVPILASLVPYERAKIADALDTINFPADTSIIKEGEPGENFYIIESGSAEVRKRGDGGKAVNILGRGDYFGELALLNDAPRAASVISKEKMKVATLGKEGFQRLLGPVQDIMRRNDPTKMDTSSDIVDDSKMGGVTGLDSYSLS